MKLHLLVFVTFYVDLFLDSVKCGTTLCEEATFVEHIPSWEANIL